jgi:hypothetical protein
MVIIMKILNLNEIEEVNGGCNCVCNCITDAGRAYQPTLGGGYGVLILNPITK